MDRETARTISKKAPSVYLNEMRAEIGSALDELLRSQRLPAGPGSPLMADDFDEFLDWRQQTLEEALAAMTGGGHAQDVRPPERSALDERVEGIELGLRRIILETLTRNQSTLPPHIGQNVHKRIVSARRRKPGLEESLSVQLEYCDLRELEAVILSDALWPQFGDRFGSKVMLSGRFTQLAELRNGLRHSRTIDDVARKDGEAAILWFRQVL
jgi:hypothetical protein